MTSGRPGRDAALDPHREDAVVHPTHDDPVARAASEVAGGPWGRRAAGRGHHGWWTLARVLAVFAVALVGLGAVQKQHCREQGWSSPDQFVHACYSDLPMQYEQSGAAAGSRPYLDPVAGEYFAQPVLTGTLVVLVAAVVPEGDATDQDRRFFDLSVLVLAVAAVVTSWAVAALSGRRPWDGALVASSPVLVTAGLLSFDLVAVALAATGLWAWARRHPGTAGVLLGLGLAVRPAPAGAVLLALLLCSIRVRNPSVGRTWALAATTWWAVNLPVMLADGRGWSAALRAWDTASVGAGSTWLVVSRLTGGVGDVVTTPVLVGAVTVGLVAVAVLVLSAPHAPRVPQVALLVLVAGLLVARSVPVQAALWLLPLLALAVPRWRVHLVWATVEVAHFVAVWFWFLASAAPDRRLPDGLYDGIVAIRVGVLVWIVVLVVLDVLRAPAAPDDVHQTHDPAAGDLADRSDSLVLHFR